MSFQAVAAYCRDDALSIACDELFVARASENILQIFFLDTAESDTPQIGLFFKIIMIASAFDRDLFHHTRRDAAIGTNEDGARAVFAATKDIYLWRDEMVVQVTTQTFRSGFHR